jgi:hypothetical protein
MRDNLDDKQTRIHKIISVNVVVGGRGVRDVEWLSYEALPQRILI